MKDTCEIVFEHEDVVRDVQHRLPDVSGMLSIFKALADETRLNIVYSLTLTEKLCVCDVAAIIGASSATASHHLRYLRDNGLATSQKEGKLVYYSLADDHVRQIIEMAYVHSKE